MDVPLVISIYFLLFILFNIYSVTYNSHCLKEDFLLKLGSNLQCRHEREQLVELMLFLKHLCMPWISNATQKEKDRHHRPAYECKKVIL